MEGLTGDSDPLFARPFRFAIRAGGVAPINDGRGVVAGEGGEDVLGVDAADFLSVDLLKPKKDIVASLPHVDSDALR